MQLSEEIPQTLTNGARGPKVHELPLLVELKYQIQWERLKVDLTELAKKRYFDRWSVARLATHFDRSPETIQMYLCRMKKDKVFKILNLSHSEKLALKPLLHEVFQGVAIGVSSPKV